MRLVVINIPVIPFFGDILAEIQGVKRNSGVKYRLRAALCLIGNKPSVFHNDIGKRGRDTVALHLKRTFGRLRFSRYQGLNRKRFQSNARNGGTLIAVNIGILLNSTVIGGKIGVFKYNLVASVKRKRIA